MRVQHLERDPLVGEPMARGPHPAHAAFTEETLDHVAVPHHVTGRERAHDVGAEAIRDPLARQRHPCQHRSVTSRLVLALAAMGVACNRSGGPEDAGAAAPAPAVPAPAPAREPAPGASAGGIPVDRPARVGTLVVNERFSVMHPSEYCLDDGFVYVGAPARVGAVNVFTAVAVAPLAGKTVLAVGAREPSLFAALDERGPCASDYGSDPRELPQMRSDWVSPEGGFRTTRQRLEKLAGFRAHSVSEISLGRELAREGETVVVELENPFAASLDALGAVAHYEGGPGKPMPLREKLALALPPGGRQRLELRAEIEAGPAGAATGTPRGWYRLESVELSGRVGQVEVDASIFVGSKRTRRGAR